MAIVLGRKGGGSGGGGGGGSLPEGWTADDPEPGAMDGGGGALLNLLALTATSFSATPEAPGDEVFDAQGGQIGNLADPADDQDAATKKYVDDTAGGGSQPQFFTPYSANQPLSSTGQSTITGTEQANYYLNASDDNKSVWNRSGSDAGWSQPSSEAILTGVSDPTVGGGVPHTVEMFYVMEDAAGNAVSLWISVGEGDTDWSDITNDTMWHGVLDLDPVSPADATGYGVASLGSIYIAGEFLWIQTSGITTPVWGKFGNFNQQGFLAILFPPEGMLANGIPVELDLEVDDAVGIKSAANEQGFSGAGFQQTVWKDGRLLDRLVDATPVASVREYAPVTADPTAGSGVPHDVPGFLWRANGDACELWLTTGPGDTAWAQMVSA